MGWQYSRIVTVSISSIEIGGACDYDAMRAEVAEGHFHGNSGFSTSDVFAVSSESGMDIGHSGSHDGGDGHGGDGHH